MFLSMWEDWKKAWQEAVSNFERELSTPEDEYPSPAGRATAMRRDLNAARNALGRLKRDADQAETDLAAEEQSEKTARRRADLAERINDAETVRIALEFAGRHAHRAGILRRKVEVLREELAMREEELSAMEQQASVELNQMPETPAPNILDREKDDFVFRKMERERKEKEAEARLEELKKRMQ